MTKPGMPLKQRDLVLLPIPFTDLTSHKRRPVIVISNDNYNSKTQDVIVVGVTSNLQEKDYCVSLKKEDMEEGELLRDSEIRSDKIYTVSQNIIIKRFGRIKESVFREVLKKINALFEAQVL